MDCRSPYGIDLIAISYFRTCRSPHGIYLRAKFPDDRPNGRQLDRIWTPPAIFPLIGRTGGTRIDWTLPLYYWPQTRSRSWPKEWSWIWPRARSWTWPTEWSSKLKLGCVPSGPSQMRELIRDLWMKLNANECHLTSVNRFERTKCWNDFEVLYLN